jgi:hypothetical protein
MTNNLARRYQEHLYAGHSYANAKLSYWDMSGESYKTIMDYEKKMIHEYLPKYNKIHNPNFSKIIKKSLTLKDLFNLDSHLLDISTRQLIGTGITVYFQYKALKDQYYRQRQILKQINSKYEELNKRIMNTMNKIKKLYVEISKDKGKIIVQVKKKFQQINSNLLKKQWNRIKSYLNNEKTDNIGIDHLKYKRKFLKIKREFVDEKYSAIRLKNNIKKQIKNKRRKTAIIGLGAILMNVIIPGFSLIEGLALAGAGASYIITENFVSSCKIYIDSLNDIINLLNYF